ncbi:MAG: hypothetical protein M1830_002337 [Pleopsidium flavum]|nr:MAG: hypothetical protein M1830_002337 [Pleopsidium flavum]
MSTRLRLRQRVRRGAQPVYRTSPSPSITSDPSESTSQDITTIEEYQHSMSDLASFDTGLGAEATAEKKPFAALLTSDSINVHVGVKRKHYCIHKKLLCSQSRYLEQLVNGSFGEADGTTLHLDDVHVEAFELFVEWMYRGATQPMHANGKWFGSRGHGEVYFLAGKWEMQALQNHAMDCLINWCRDHDGRADGEDIREIFKSTDRSSPMRRFVVCQSVHFLGTTECSDEEEKWRDLIDMGGDFGLAMIELIIDPSRRKAKNPTAQPNCNFHSHSSGKRCHGR